MIKGLICRLWRIVHRFKQYQLEGPITITQILGISGILAFPSIDVLMLRFVNVCSSMLRVTNSFILCRKLLRAIISWYFCSLSRIVYMDVRS